MKIAVQATGIALAMALLAGLALAPFVITAENAIDMLAHLGGDK